MLALCPRSLSPGPTFPCPRTPVSSTFSLPVTRAPLPVHQRRTDGIITRATWQWSLRRHGILCFYFVGAATIIKVSEINGGDSATNWIFWTGFQLFLLTYFIYFLIIWDSQLLAGTTCSLPPRWSTSFWYTCGYIILPLVSNYFRKIYTDTLKLC